MSWEPSEYAAERYDRVYLIYPEGEMHRSVKCQTPWMVEIVAFWVGLKTWISFNPQRVVIKTFHVPKST